MKKFLRKHKKAANVLKRTSMFLLAAMVFLGTTFSSLADATGQVTQPITKSDKPYLSLGKDLTDDQRNTVLDLLGLTDKNLADYDVLYVTNQDERDYLGSYMDAKIIGTHALSSCVVVKRESGHGILVSTKNITYCTTGMYRNALSTAGVTDADVVVAGPFNITGTAALVGAMKAYSNLTGDNISQDSMDTAVDELVTTSDLAQNIGSADKAEQLMNYVKGEVVGNNITNSGDIVTIIQNGANSLNLSLSDKDVKKISSVMEKVGDLDLNIDTIKDQAKDLFEKVEQNIGDIDTDGLWEKIKAFFANIINAIVNFFKNLF